MTLEIEIRSNVEDRLRFHFFDAKQLNQFAYLYGSQRNNRVAQSIDETLVDFAPALFLFREAHSEL